MSGHHYDDWETHEEAAARLARTEADYFRHDQQDKERIRRWTMEKMEKLELDDLSMLYGIACEIEDFQAFFRVIKSLK